MARAEDQPSAPEGPNPENTKQDTTPTRDAPEVVWGGCKEPKDPVYRTFLENGAREVAAPDFTKVMIA